MLRTCLECGYSTECSSDEEMLHSNDCNAILHNSNWECSCEGQYCDDDCDGSFNV